MVIINNELFKNIKEDLTNGCLVTVYLNKEKNAFGYTKTGCITGNCKIIKTLNKFNGTQQELKEYIIAEYKKKIEGYPSIFFLVNFTSNVPSSLILISISSPFFIFSSFFTSIVFNSLISLEVIRAE